MDEQFWLEKWEKQDIPFNQGQVNPWLVKRQNMLGDLNDKHVLVPLSGKSIDMFWLWQQGASVTGVELSELAASAFFEEHDLAYQKKTLADFTLYQHDNLQIITGDFFKVTKKQLPTIDLVYDRAALIALPSDLRRIYAQHNVKLLERGANLFLITIEYELDEVTKPPFSLSDQHIHSLYAEHFKLELVEKQKIEQVDPHLAERGITNLVQSAYWMTRL